MINEYVEKGDSWDTGIRRMYKKIKEQQEKIDRTNKKLEKDLDLKQE